MRLSEILQLECVKVPLESTSKQAAIFELVELITKKLVLASSQSLRASVWQRETTRTTGIGHGIAIPHAKTTDCTRLIMAVGKPPYPIEFEAVDKKPVDLIFLLASPVDQTGPHIQALAQITRMLADEDKRRAMKLAPNSEALFRLIVEQEAGRT